jgi:DUF1707 SHOCT-like domain
MPERATVNRLRDAAAEGRPTLEELTDRVEAAADAVTRSDLVPLTSDLPTTAAIGVAAQSGGVRGVGDVKRSGVDCAGRERVPHLVWPHQARPAPGADQRDGDPHLTPVRYSAINLLVPEGVEVEVQDRTHVGQTNLQASSGVPAAPRIVLTGRTFFGDIKVRHRRLWDKLGRRGE